MMQDNWGSGFVQPGARSTRQENIETEVRMPRKQAELRSVADIVGVLLIMAALSLLGRWAIWLVVFMFLYSQYYDIVVDAIAGRLHNPAAALFDMGTISIKWLWPFLGYPFLRMLFPITWTRAEMIWQRAVFEFAWPFIFSVASPWALPISWGIRLILLVLCIAPLFTWRSLRDRMRWSIEEFTPFGPVNVAEQGIDPRQWGPKPVVVEDEEDAEGMGIIFERVEGDAHSQQIADGVYMSNGMGSSHVRTDMGWVTESQWREIARLLVVERQPFTEDVLGRGRVFPTHGQFSQKYQARLGYRFWREQMLEAGRAEQRGSGINSGTDLTAVGKEFLTRRFLNGERGAYDE
jgi:hypothetical protein